MNITAEQIKVLRDKTGVSIMQCRKALEEAQGDIEKAIILLRKKSSEIASKKGDRTFGAGAIASYIHNNGNVGTLVELVSETDFVSGNAEFKALAYDIAMHIAASNPQFLRKEDMTEEEKKKLIEVFTDEAKDKPEAMRQKIVDGKLNAYLAEKTLLDQPYIKNPDLTISALIENAIQKFGEKVEVARFVRFKVLEK
ncbi:MAG: elongation factor Ts [Candidatus Taylorbacteria bacterium]|nr:elongation factor Ts [Candidatus Taylorbacteria bacterium]